MSQSSIRKGRRSRLPSSGELLFSVICTITEKQTPRKQRMSAIWTVLGSWLAISLFALLNHGYGDFFESLLQLLSGQFEAGVYAFEPGVRMAPVIAAMVSVNIVLMVPIGIMIVPFIKKGKDTERKKSLFEGNEPKKQYPRLMAVLFGEELFARMLFFMTLSGVALMVLSPKAAFWTLFILGNGLWALGHLYNYKDIRNRRNVILVVPQFVAGIMITAVFVPHGWLAALIAHVLYDMVLFCADRHDVFNWGEVMVVIWHGFLLLASGVIFFAYGDESLMDMRVWMDADTTKYALPGWELHEYFAAAVFLTSLVTIALELLLFDRDGGANIDAVRQSWVRDFAFVLIGMLLIIATEDVDAPVAFKVLVLAIVAPAARLTASGSGVARAFHEGALIFSVLIAFTLALDVKHAVWLVGLIALLWIPDYVIRYHDHDDPDPKNRWKLQLGDITAVIGTQRLVGAATSKRIT